MDEPLRAEPFLSTGIQPGIAFVKHPSAGPGVCSIRTFTFDQHGHPTVTVLDLEAEQARSLRDALNSVLGDQ